MKKNCALDHYLHIRYEKNWSTIDRVETVYRKKIKAEPNSRFGLEENNTTHHPCEIALLDAFSNMIMTNVRVGSRVKNW